jgi:hypothetical protein
MKYTRIGWLALASSFALTPLARAEPAPAAEALFQAGRDAARQGRHAEACAKFSESQRLEPALGTRLNLALCEEELGHLAEAWALFRALSLALPRNDERMALVESHARALAARVPTLVLRAGAPFPAGARVEVAGLSVTPSAFGVAIPLNPSRLSLRVFAPGFETRVYELVLAEGQKAELLVEPGAKQGEPASRPTRREPPPPPPPALPASNQALRVSGVIGLGLAGSALLGSLMAGYVAMRNQHTMEEECDASRACSEAGLSAARSGERFATLATASFALSVAFAAGGTTLLLVASRPTPHTGSGPGSSAPQLAASLQGSWP